MNHHHPAPQPSVKPKHPQRKFRRLPRWQAKIDFIQAGIKSLEAATDPIPHIAAFLLKCQMVEFELKQLITNIERHLSYMNTSTVVRRKTKTPVDYDRMRYTLGQLILELENFGGEDIPDLQEKLKDLINLRNLFNHHLFNPKEDINHLAQESKRGSKIGDELLQSFAELSGRLQEEPPSADARSEVNRMKIAKNPKQ